MSIRCHVAPEAFDAEPLCIEGDEAHHLLHVLRVRSGNAVTLFDGAGRECDATIREAERHRLLLDRGPQRDIAAPRPRLVLVQSLVKPAAQDWLLQKATELGAAEIRLVHSRHCTQRLEDALKNSRQERNRRIVINAARQCGSAWLPNLPPPASLASVLDGAARFDGLLLADLAEGIPPLRTVLESWTGARETVACIVGPEGDLDEDEKQACREAGAVGVALGSRTLRAETAAMHLLSVLQYALSPGEGR